MAAHLVILVLLMPVLFLLLPVRLVTTGISGIMAAIPLIGEVYLLTLSLLRSVTLFSLAGLAWLYLRLPWPLRWLPALPAIPLAWAGYCVFWLTGAISADPEDRLNYFALLTCCFDWPLVHVKDGEGVPLVEDIRRETGQAFFLSWYELARQIAQVRYMARSFG